MSRNKVVLAYSGGLDTSVSIKWIQEKYDSDVITLTLDLGQEEDFKRIEEKANSLGVLRHYNLDMKDTFANDYVMQSVKANGLYQGKYPLSTALGRPLIAKKLVEIAEMETADAVAHGALEKGTTRLESILRSRHLILNLE